MNSMLFVLLTVCLACVMSASTGRDFDLEAQHDQRSRLVNDIADWVLSDPFLVSAFTTYSKSKTAELMMEDNSNVVRNVNTVNKRNSELLNSLLGLPKNILRSGRK